MIPAEPYEADNVVSAEPYRTSHLEHIFCNENNFICHVLMFFNSCSYVLMFHAKTKSPDHHVSVLSWKLSVYDSGHASNSHVTPEELL